jgi:hypothetical protein
VAAPKQQQQQQQPGPGGGAFKYKEVVRKQAEREVLPAFECAACRSFYSALSSWGGALGSQGGQLPLPGCAHAQSASAAAAAVGVAVGPSQADALTGLAGLGPALAGDAEQQQRLAQQLLQQNGRHRARWQMPSTPQGYWNIGFTDASLDGAAAAPPHH